MSVIKKPSELSNRSTIKTLIYGQPGAGKSTLALSAPAPVMIDCDRGVHRINPAHLCPTVEVNNYNDVLAALEENLSEYKTIIFDTGSKLLDYMSDYIVKNDPKMAQKDGALTLKGYGVRKKYFRDLLSKLHVMGKHVIFVAHESEQKDGDNYFVRPEIGGSSGGDLIKELDAVFYLSMVGKKRTLHTFPTDKFYAKNSIGLAEMVEIPDTEKHGNVLMTNIFDKYEEATAKKQAKQKEYEELMAEFKDKLNEVETGEDLNALVEWSKDIDHIWDSKLRQSKEIALKAKELGVKLNKKEGIYEKS